MWLEQRATVFGHLNHGGCDVIRPKEKFAKLFSKVKSEKTFEKRITKPFFLEAGKENETNLEGKDKQKPCQSTILKLRLKTLVNSTLRKLFK